MDDAVTRTSADVFRCPGESYSINRAAHLGRLTSYYPACRQCERRHETHTLNTAQRQALDELDHSREGPLTWDAEGAFTRLPGGLPGAIVQRLAMALAVVLWRAAGRGERIPKIVVATDGHWRSAEPMAEACHTLALAGCAVIEAGAASGASLAVLARELATDAALWLGNITGEPHGAGVRFWGAGGRPWSSPGSLDLVRQTFAASSARPRRHGGERSRASAEQVYLPKLASAFHGLRPLRFVVDTACAPLLCHLRQMLVNSACEVFELARSENVASHLCATPAFASDRWQRVGRTVSESSAHFGVWIDGNAETLCLVDERGQVLSPTVLITMLAEYICRDRTGISVVLSVDTADALERPLDERGARVVRCEPTREQVAATMSTAGALFGIGPGERLWYASRPPTADALATLSLILTILSETDRPLSEVARASAG